MYRKICSFVATLMLFAMARGGEVCQKPFPQHTVYTLGTIKPSNGSQAELDGATLAFYNDWKKRYLRSMAHGEMYVFCNAEKEFEERNTRSISEGHGYGMVATALMAGADPDAHATFDALYRFFRSHPTELHQDLMAWRQVSHPGSGALVEGNGDKDSATDGDLDIAYALLLADRQWGSKGEIHYKEEARKVLAAILSGDVDPERHTLTLGDWEDNENPAWGSLRPSDFMPQHLKQFAKFTGDVRWQTISDRTYEILANFTGEFSPETALLPDFVIFKNGSYLPAQPHFLEGKNDGHCGYNACRCPWHIGIDYLLTGDPRALRLLQPLNRWIIQRTGGDPENVNAGYRLDGKPLKEDDSAAFLGPLAVAAMAEPQNQEWLNALWGDLLRRKANKEGYFGNSIKLLTMIVISGNWW